MAKAKIGDRIVIKGFAGDEPSADDYIGKVGIVESIDDASNIRGTWGGLGLLPEDDYEVLAEGEIAHTFDVLIDPRKVYILPRELHELCEQVYNAGNHNVDCIVDGHIYTGC